MEELDFLLPAFSDFFSGICANQYAYHSFYTAEFLKNKFFWSFADGHVHIVPLCIVCDMCFELKDLAS